MKFIFFSQSIPCNPIEYDNEYVPAKTNKKLRREKQETHVMHRTEIQP